MTSQQVCLYLQAFRQNVMRQNDLNQMSGKISVIVGDTAILRYCDTAILRQVLVLRWFDIS